MSHQPEGPISLALEHFKNLLASSATFQAMALAADASQAARSVHLVSLPIPDDREGYTRQELEGHRPFHLIDFPESGEAFGAQRIAETCFEASGQLLWVFESNVPDALRTDPAGAKMGFLNQLGQIMAEMFESLAAGGGAFLSVTEFKIVDGPKRSSEDVLATEGDFMSAMMLVSFGT